MATMVVKTVKTAAFKDAHLTRAEISAMVGAEMVSSETGSAKWQSGLHRDYKDELVRSLLSYGPHRLEYPMGSGRTIYEFSPENSYDEDYRWRLETKQIAPTEIFVEVVDSKRAGDPVFTCRLTDDDFEYFDSLSFEGTDEDWASIQ